MTKDCKGLFGKITEKNYMISDKKCPKCQDSLRVGMTLHNRLDNLKNRITYPHMARGESMHIECYIQHVIDSYLKEKLDGL